MGLMDKLAGLSSGPAEVVRRMTIAARAGAQSLWRYNHDLLLDYYEGRQYDDLAAEIRKRFVRTGEAVFEDAITYNLIRQIVDARSQVYHRPPSRQLVNAKTGKPLDSDAQQSRLWADLVERGEIDNRMEFCNQRVNLWCNAVAWPRHRELNGEEWIKLEVVGPHQIWCIQDPNNVDDLQACEAVAILLAGRTDSDGIAEPSKFGCFTQGDAGGTGGEYYEFTGEITDEGGLRLLEVTLPAKAHGYGMIPLVPFHDGMPSGQLWVTEDEDFVGANRAVNVMLTDLEHLRKRQSHSTLVRKGLLNPTSEVVVGVDAVIDLQGTEQEDAKYISPNARLAESKDIVEQTIKMQAGNRGISPNRFSVTERNALSGIAKALDEMDLLEDVARQQRRYARPEARLFNAIRAVWNASVDSGQWLSMDVRQQVGFVTFMFMTDPKVEWTLAKEQAEAGARPVWSLTRFSDRDLDDKAAQANYEENMTGLVKHNALMNPGPFAGLFGGDGAVEPKALPAGDVVDGEIVEEVTEGDVTPGTKSEGEISAAPEETLNGAQVKELKQMVIDAVEGAMPMESAKALILAAYPIDEKTVDAIIAPITAEWLAKRDADRAARAPDFTPGGGPPQPDEEPSE